MKNKNNLIIGLLTVLVLGLAGYIVYDKVFVENNDSNIQDNNKNNQEENNNSNVQDNNNQEENLNVDFTKLFKEAEKLYALFTGHYYLKLDNEECIYANGHDYCLVTDDNFQFNNLNELKNELSNLFTNRIVNKLFNTMVESINGEWDTLYKAFDGKIYRISGYVSQDSYDSSISNITSTIANDNLVVLTNNIAFPLDGPGNEVATARLYYILSKNESGNWIFENFELPISVMR